MDVPPQIKQRKRWIRRSRVRRYAGLGALTAPEERREQRSWPVGRAPGTARAKRAEPAPDLIRGQHVFNHLLARTPVSATDQLGLTRTSADKKYPCESVQIRGQNAYVWVYRDGVNGRRRSADLEQRRLPRATGIGFPAATVHAGNRLGSAGIGPVGALHHQRRGIFAA